jgi:hypothetical protein
MSAWCSSKDLASSSSLDLSVYLRHTARTVKLAVESRTVYRPRQCTRVRSCAPGPITSLVILSGGGGRRRGGTHHRVLPVSTWVGCVSPCPAGYAPQCRLGARRPTVCQSLWPPGCRRLSPTSFAPASSAALCLIRFVSAASAEQIPLQTYAAPPPDRSPSPPTSLCVAHYIYVAVADAGPASRLSPLITAQWHEMGDCAHTLLPCAIYTGCCQVGLSRGSLHVSCRYPQQAELTAALWVM